MYFECWLLRYFELLSLREKKIPPPVGRCCYSLTSNQSLENRIILASKPAPAYIYVLSSYDYIIIDFQMTQTLEGRSAQKDFFANSILYRNAVVVKLEDFTTSYNTTRCNTMQWNAMQLYQVQYNAMQCNATLPGAMPASSTLPVSSLLLLPLLEFLLKIT